MPRHLPAQGPVFVKGIRSILGRVIKTALQFGNAACLQLFYAFQPKQMQKLGICTVLLFFATALQAQTKEQGFDYAFKPTAHAARYWVITKKQDSLWHRQAFFVPEKTMAMEGWYKDEACEIPHGTVSWYHPNRMIQSKREYKNGQRHGMQLSFHDNGYLSDSAQYVAGKLKGIQLGWNKEGFRIDSLHFDGAGNGTQVSWYAGGHVASAGMWTADTVRRGRWKYYHANGQLRGTEDFVGGKRTAIACYDEQGNALTDCDEVEAQFKGNWASYLGRKLKADVPVKNGAPAGQYTAVVQFIVGTDGSVENIEAITKFGYGMEEEVVRIIQQSPKWMPARQWGKTVRAYRRQPITFVVSQR